MLRMTGLNRLEKVGALLGSQNVRTKYFKGKKKKSPVKWLKFRGPNGDRVERKL